MYLKSITLKGFKSFPDRKRLDFASGVSVIVGPNGSGKSNITDAVLWALGEQSPQAVRGHTMQDVIFAGGAGVRARREALVEVVIDNFDGRIDTDFSEVSIARRIDRSGHSEYRLNGARCRLVDVLEALSDSGLGKEMHSVVSQGRVEEVINSKPLDRRMLIEEAAGLGKHRKRRRRAQLKLERTQENLSRALDVEREARSRLRPLKRQAEAADLQERLNRQSLELKGRLVLDQLRDLKAESAVAQAEATAAREERDRLDEALRALAEQRGAVEDQMAERSHHQKELLSALYTARSARERVRLARDRSVAAGRAIEDRIAQNTARERRAEGLLQELEMRPALDSQTTVNDSAGTIQATEGKASITETEARNKLTALESELESLRRDPRHAQDETIRSLDAERAAAEAKVAELSGRIDEMATRLGETDAKVADHRRSARETADARDGIQRELSGLGVELEAVEERLRRGAGLGDEAQAMMKAGMKLLADLIEIDPGYETAVAIALGERLRAGVANDLAEGVRLLEATGTGGRVMVKARVEATDDATPPVEGAEPLLKRLSIASEACGVVDRLLADAWLVEDLRSLPEEFAGVAITRDGMAYRGGLGELQRAPVRQPEGALIERDRQKRLKATFTEVEGRLEDVQRKLAAAVAAVSLAERQRDETEASLRALMREREEHAQAARRAEWLAESRRKDVGYGQVEVRVARLEADMAIYRAAVERAAAERWRLEAERTQLQKRIAGDRLLLAISKKLARALAASEGAAHSQCERLRKEVDDHHATGETAASRLRELAQAEYRLQSELTVANRHATECEVKAAQVADREKESATELAEIGKQLGREMVPSDEPLEEQEHEQIMRSLDRLERRRQKIGPVNPLAQKEYEEAVAHADELKAQREDAEKALAELEQLIKETDRQIHETFERTFTETANFFEEISTHLFPGGKGRLRLVMPDRPRPVLGGADPAEVAEPGGTEQDGRPAVGGEGQSPGGQGREPDVDEWESRQELAGVEVELTPAGKATRRLSLLSGGEKALAALAFLFAVFLARPCPFYILDEVEAALDDHNIGRFLELLRRYRSRAQFIVVTHQRRTLDAADVVYGVSMGGDGVSKVVSRRLPARQQEAEGDARQLVDRADGERAADERAVAERAVDEVGLEAPEEVSSQVA